MGWLLLIDVSNYHSPHIVTFWEIIPVRGEVMHRKCSVNVHFSDLEEHVQ